MPAFNRCSPAGCLPLRRRLAGLAVLLVAIGWLAGGRPAVAQAGSPADMLPADIKQSGVLKAGMPLDFAPYNFLDPKGEMVGLDVDMFRALAGVLKVKPEIDRLAFASIIPSVSGGRVDVGMSVMAILPARLKLVSFVRYALLANGLIVRAGNPSHIGNNDACGHSIAVEKGTQPVEVWEGVSKQCVQAGKPAIQLSTFDGEGPQVLAVQSGRADAAGVSFATAMMASETSNGKLEGAPGGAVKGFTVDAGIAFKAGRDDLGNAVEAALKVLVADGTYNKILQKWHLEDTAASPIIVK
jgi:polar amino acid transport system substrate-binding protein